MALGKQEHIEVPADKATYLKQIAQLSTDSLKILAAKAGNPGIEQKLKQYQSFI